MVSSRPTLNKLLVTSPIAKSLHSEDSDKRVRGRPLNAPAGAGVGSSGSDKLARVRGDFASKCLVRATKASVSDSKLFQCVTCEQETGLKSGITETDVELLCTGRFHEKALHEILRDYVLKQEGAVVCGSCGEANVVSDVTHWDNLRCLGCAGYMMGKRIAEEAADKAFNKLERKQRHATCPGCEAVVQKTLRNSV
ncbi:hypothetical protein KFL_000930140 [Klebsormidium nitens]|uniref:Uncharacterized protein n=1 Tax=Klebsormidium nitens TaxID=105231 RepID=A0A1Y1I175_KLENI|nr:hypothetical protein KFL_000930140 [Klebsormidium nitens]|eukprot:GAQ81868.1 hypothetical protein KFL_000930140 [Klebsormidium nitens]